MIYDECLTRLGKLRFILKENGALERILLNDDLWSLFAGEKTFQRSTELGKPVREQLQDYCNGDRKQFDLAFELKGTTFQKQTWHALREIPYGETKSYSDIAQTIGNPNAIRAVGHANGANPLPIIFPCHRVIGKNNALTGYAGGLDMKKKLLQIEGVLA